MFSELDIKNFGDNGYAVIAGDDGKKIHDTIAEALNPVIETVVEHEKFPTPSDWNDYGLGKKIDYIVNNEVDRVVSRSLYEVMPTATGLVSLLNHPVLLAATKVLGQELPVCATLPVTRIDRPQDDVFPTPPHQDYWYSLLSDNALVFWIPISELSDDMGYLEVLPGSHKEGLAPFRPTGKHEPYTIAKEIVNDDWVKVPMGAEEVLVFNSYLVHKSGDNITKDKSRFTVQLRYNDLKSQDKMTSSYTPYHSRYVKEKQEALLEQWREGEFVSGG